MIKKWGCEQQNCSAALSAQKLTTKLLCSFERAKAHNKTALQL
jgi:hypothetical protein